jgi:hypothetical protein
MTQLLFRPQASLSRQDLETRQDLPSWIPKTSDITAHAHARARTHTCSLKGKRTKNLIFPSFLPYISNSLLRPCTAAMVGSLNSLCGNTIRAAAQPDGKVLCVSGNSLGETELERSNSGQKGEKKKKTYAWVKRIVAEFSMTK